jgi:hypothetical protein
VLDGARMGALGEIVVRLRQEVPVGEVERGGHETAARLRHCHRRRDELVGERCDEEDEERRRHEAPDAPCIEGDEPHPAGAHELANQQRGDEEAREDEEDVDADVAVAEPGHAGVEEDHEQRGDGSDPVEPWAVLEAQRRALRDGARARIIDCDANSRV